jgi:hypothetical protein
MGGHSSKQTVDVSTSVTANIMQTTAQNCINVAYGGNTITINGNYNVVSGVDQTVSISINSACSTFAAQNSTFDADLENALSQILSDQEVALTEWMDNSQDDQNTDVKQNVTTNFTQSTVQNCVNNLDGYNILSVTGSGNVVQDITQTATLNVISQCILKGQQTSDVVSSITNTVNQHSVYTSENPLAFIADAVASVLKSAMAIAAVLFIVILCFVFVFMVAGRRKRSPPVVLAMPAMPAAPSQLPGAAW